MINFHLFIALKLNVYEISLSRLKHKEFKRRIENIQDDIQIIHRETF